MKINFSWRLLGGLPLILRLVAAEPLPLLDIWSAREQVLPFQARQSWVLLAEHGRVLAGAADPGKISLTLPALNDGCTETARLQIDHHEVARIRIWSPRILTGWEADFRSASRRVSAALQENGLLPRSASNHDCAISVVGSAEEAESIAGLSLFFAEKRDFPLSIAAIWTDFHFHRAKNPGCLSVLSTKDGEVIDCQGRLAYLILSRDAAEKNQRGQHQLVILTPDFAFSDLDNIILLNTIIKEHRL